MTTEIARSLDRFVKAQEPIFDTAIAEIWRGDKRSHWMWFIFPQLVQLGRSPIAKFYGIADAREADAYLDHPVLGARYRACVHALQDLETSDPVQVFGAVDAIKLRSSLTLFEAVHPQPLLTATIERWFGGIRDPETLQLLSG